MTDNWLNKWEDRYREEAYASGTEPKLHEGLYHNGKGSVIRFAGRKKRGA